MTREEADARIRQLRDDLAAAREASGLIQAELLAHQKRFQELAEDCRTCVLDRAVRMAAYTAPPIPTTARVQQLRDELRAQTLEREQYARLLREAGFEVPD